MPPGCARVCACSEAAGETPLTCVHAHACACVSARELCSRCQRIPAAQWRREKAALRFAAAEELCGALLCWLQKPWEPLPPCGSCCAPPCAFLWRLIGSLWTLISPTPMMQSITRIRVKQVGVCFPPLRSGFPFGSSVNVDDGSRRLLAQM